MSDFKSRSWLLLILLYVTMKEETTKVPSSKEQPLDDGTAKKEPKPGPQDVESQLEAKAEQAIALNHQMQYQTSQGTTTSTTAAVEPGAVAVHGVGILDDTTIVGGTSTAAAAARPPSSLAAVQGVDAHVVMNEDAFELAVQEKVLQRFQTAQTANTVEIIPDRKSSPEEYQDKRRTTMLTCVCIFGTICFAVTLAIMLTYGNRNKMSSSESGIGGGQGGSGGGGGGDGTPSSSVFQTMYDTLVTVSGEDVFLEMDSPQFRALEWISYEDEIGPSLDSDGDTTMALKERYVLSLLYFATGGDNWNKDIGFLSNSGICNWNEASTGATNGTSVSAEVDTLTLGVRCNDDGSVVDISLGKLELLCYYCLLPLAGMLPDPRTLLPSLSKISQSITT